MLTECAICYSLQACADNGEALICEDRAGCQRRILENVSTVEWIPISRSSREVRNGIRIYDTGAGFGRRLDRLMLEDRDLLVAILDGAQRAYWPKLAHAYLSALGIDSAESRASIVPCVCCVWSQIVKESTHAT